MHQRSRDSEGWRGTNAVIALGIIVGIAASAPAARAAEADALRGEIRACAEKHPADTTARLECFDGVAKKLAPTPPAASETASAATLNACAKYTDSCATDLHEHLARDPGKPWIDPPREIGVAAVTHRIINEHLEPTYVSFGTGIRLNGDQTRTKMLYEAQVLANLPLAGGNDLLYQGIPWRLDVPVRIGVRQLRDESYPVNTPSFNPGIRLFVAPFRGSGGIRTGSLVYFSGGLHHYSNGQDGNAALADGSANTRNGTFSTNYVELAAHAAGHYGPFQWGRVAFRQHFYGTFEPFQQGQYERRSLALQARTKEFFASKVQLRLTGAWRSGYPYVVKNDVDPSRTVDAGLRDRLGATAELVIRPTWDLFSEVRKNFALFARYDIGYDYYNINFQNRMHRIQLGVMSTYY